MQLGEDPFQPSVSIGIALPPRHGEGIEELMQLADSAMYQAKQAGGNRCRIAEPVCLPP